MRVVVLGVRREVHRHDRLILQEPLRFVEPPLQPVRPQPIGRQASARPELFLRRDRADLVALQTELFVGDQLKASLT